MNKISALSRVAVAALAAAWEATGASIEATARAATATRDRAEVLFMMGSFLLMNLGRRCVRFAMDALQQGPLGADLTQRKRPGSTLGGARCMSAGFDRDQVQRGGCGLCATPRRSGRDVGFGFRAPGARRWP